jgi:hypothetical protein
MRKIAFCACLVFGLTITSATAGTYSTSIVTHGSGQTVLCMVSNVGTAPMNVAVTLHDSSGAALTPAADSCNNVALPAGWSCDVDMSPSDFAPVRCAVDASSSKMRAALVVYRNSDSSVVVSVPATKK